MAEIPKHVVDSDMSEPAINRRLKRLGDLYRLAASLKKAVPGGPPVNASPTPVVRESPARLPPKPVNPA